MHILIVRNNFNSQATDASLLLATYLGTQGISYTIVESCDLGISGDNQEKVPANPSFFDMVVALGGDGTILRTARYIGVSQVPILGINFGHLGFLANPCDDGVVAILAAALSEDTYREERSNLQIDLVCEGDAESDEPRSFFALNELAINRGSLGRIIDFDLNISGSNIANMRGDGLIIATATGSTAYALSAGGPLISPSFRGLEVVPLAPHSLRSRAILTDQSDVVEVDMADDPSSREAVFYIDGDKLELESRVTKAMVKRGESPTILLRYKHSDFYAHSSEVFFK